MTWVRHTSIVLAAGSAFDVVEWERIFGLFAGLEVGDFRHG